MCNKFLSWEPAVFSMKILLNFVKQKCFKLQRNVRYVERGREVGIRKIGDKGERLMYIYL